MHWAVRDRVRAQSLESELSRPTSRFRAHATAPGDHFGRLTRSRPSSHLACSSELASGSLLIPSRAVARVRVVSSDIAFPRAYIGLSVIAYARNHSSPSCLVPHRVSARMQRLPVITWPTYSVQTEFSSCMQPGTSHPP